MTFRLFAVSILMVFALVGVGAAQTGDIFTVPKVTVYAEGENASEAQSRAQTQGRRRAMDLLLRRLTAEEDWQYLPNLARGEPAQAPASIPTTGGFDEFGGIVPIATKSPVAIDPSLVEAMEEGFAVFDEKSSPTSYRAKITYRFDPAAVRSLLEVAGLPYSEAQARRVLLVPVLETDNGVYLWETKNPWARAWLERPLLNELTPMLLPLGDRQDVESITAGQASDLDVEGLGKLASRYRVNQVIVAKGKLQEVDGEFRLLVRLYDGYFSDRADTNAAARASAERYDSGDGFGVPGVASESVGRRGQVLGETFFRGASDDFPALAQRAVETSVARYAKAWKSKTLVDHSSVRSLRITAWFRGLAEWGTIQRALEGTPLVTDMKVGAMNRENAVIDLEVIGDNNQLALAMRQSNLMVWQANDGTWNIADNARAKSLQIELNDVALSRREMDRFNEPAFRDPSSMPGVEGLDPALIPPGANDPALGDEFAPVILDGPVALEPATPTEDPSPEQ